MWGYRRSAAADPVGVHLYDNAVFPPQPVPQADLAGIDFYDNRSSFPRRLLAIDELLDSRGKGRVPTALTRRAE